MSPESPCERQWFPVSHQRFIPFNEFKPLAYFFLGHSSPVCSQSVMVCSLVEPCHGKNDENQNMVYVSTMLEPLTQKERRHQHGFLTSVWLHRPKCKGTDRELSISTPARPRPDLHFYWISTRSSYLPTFFSDACHVLPWRSKNMPNLSKWFVSTEQMYQSCFESLLSCQCMLLFINAIVAMLKILSGAQNSRTSC